MADRTRTDRTLIDIVEMGFDGWNSRDYDKIGNKIGDDYVMESDAIEHPLRGREALLAFARTYLTAFPDLEFTLVDVFATSDRVVASWEARGTHQGELNGIAPTNRQVRVHGCTISHFREGRMTKQHAFWDSASLLKQLGQG